MSHSLHDTGKHTGAKYLANVLNSRERRIVKEELMVTAYEEMILPENHRHSALWMSS